MTREDILNLIARLRNVAADEKDRGNPDFASKLRAFAEDLEADLRKGELP